MVVVMVPVAVLVCGCDSGVGLGVVIGLIGVVAVTVGGDAFHLCHVHTCTHSLARPFLNSSMLLLPCLAVLSVFQDDVGFRVRHVQAPSAVALHPAEPAADPNVHMGCWEVGS